MKYIYYLLLACVVTSCGNSSAENDLATTEKSEETPNHSNKDFKYWTWITASPEKLDKEYSAEFKKYKEHGIDAVLINTEADVQLLSELALLAAEEGLEVHAWIFTVNRPGDKEAEKYPEWYAVSRDGRSTYNEPPYVDYYKWLCPTREESKQHILSLVEGLAKVKGVESVHLDYIRYSDIFLPIGLLPKYGLEQNEELPEFDFCYCEVCTAEFEKEHHKNPNDFNNPAIDMEWKQFRLNKVKAIVDEAYEIAHNNGKYLTAAVFPYPEMADHMVRQRWDKWNVDMVLPMIYQNFYNEEIDWIGFATGQGVVDLKGTDTELHTGIYLPELNVEELKEAINYARENGAKGVAFFDGGAFTPEKLEAIKASKED
ncbi:putative glycoside hydrolase [Salegentibacter sp. Hel_I_6]|uniref:putative glycoside hydrolase n=1 Tax=Salegentibacter sp. Hel_I_6 TaxID=1250278 RepID=UPI0005674CCB|nr:putative glycoside hydrolase [Salegentibacter sp. Hel_I_6]